MVESLAASDIVRCVDAARTYGRGRTAVVAVQKLTCVVRAETRAALVGPSGSGKSTVLHLLAGLEQPTAGSVSWPALGGSPLGRPGLVGHVFQGPSLLPPLDVTENVALPLLLAGVRQAQVLVQVADALRRAGVDDLAGRLPEEISGGQAQRVAVARAIAGGPRLILADEPTGQLDAAHRDQIVDLLLAVADAHHAGLVVATHDPHVADRLSTRWAMHDGSLVAESRC